MQQMCLPQKSLLLVICLDSLTRRLSFQRLGLHPSLVSHLGDWGLASADHAWVFCEYSHTYFLLIFTFLLDWPAVFLCHLIFAWLLCRWVTYPDCLHDMSLPALNSWICWSLWTSSRLSVACRDCPEDQEMLVISHWPVTGPVLPLGEILYWT